MTHVKCACDKKHATTRNATARDRLKAGRRGRAMHLRVVADRRGGGPLCSDQRVAVSVRMQS